MQLEPTTSLKVCVSRNGGEEEGASRRLTLGITAGSLTWNRQEQIIGRPSTLQQSFWMVYP